MTFTVTVEKCQHPYIVYMRHNRVMSYVVRSDVLRWLRENIAKGDYEFEIDSYGFTIRLSHDSDATLLKLNFQ